MPAARSRKGKGRAEPYNPTAELPLGKQLAHTGQLPFLGIPLIS